MQLSTLDSQGGNGYKTRAVVLDPSLNGVQQNYDSDQAIQIVISPAALQCIDELQYTVNATRTQGLTKEQHT